MVLRGSSGENTSIKLNKSVIKLLFIDQTAEVTVFHKMKGLHGPALRHSNNRLQESGLQPNNEPAGRECCHRDSRKVGEETKRLNLEKI